MLSPTNPPNNRCSLESLNYGGLDTCVSKVINGGTNNDYANQ